VVWAGADRRTEEQAVSHQVVPGEFYFWRISCVLLLLLLAGCLSDAPHATTLSLVRGDLLPLDHPWTRTRLEVEAGHDPTLRRWLAAEGLPDYLLVDSEERLRMFYVATDQMVVFQREDEPASAAEVLPRIGALYHARHRMRKRGWVAAEWGVSEKGRRARYYALMAKGRQELATEEALWSRYVAAVARITGEEPA